MADKQISELSDGTRLQTSDSIVVERGSSNYKITGANFDESIAGDPGFEGAGININGTTYDSILKVSNIGSSKLAQFILHRHNTGLQPVLLSARTNSDTASHVDVTNGMDLFTIYASGYAGDNYKLFGGITFEADDTGTISNSSAPGKMQFQVTADGAVFPSTWLTVTNDKKAVFAGAVEVANVPSNGDDVINLTYLQSALASNTVSANASGIWAASQSTTIKMYVYEGVVSVTFTQALSTGTIGSSISFSDVIPVGFRPPTTITLPIIVKNNGSDVMGNIQISTGGTITIFGGLGTTNFTGSNTEGFAAFGITYPLV